MLFYVQLKFGFLFLAYKFYKQLFSLDNVSRSMFLFFRCFISSFAASVDYNIHVVWEVMQTCLSNPI